MWSSYLVISLEEEREDDETLDARNGQILVVFLLVVIANEEAQRRMEARVGCSAGDAQRCLD